MKILTVTPYATTPTTSFEAEFDWQHNFQFKSFAARKGTIVQINDSEKLIKEGFTHIQIRLRHESSELIEI